MAVTLILVFRVVLDIDKKVVETHRAFGFWVKTVPMEKFAGLSTTRTKVNGIYTGTSMEMHFDGGPDLLLAKVFLTKKLAPLAKETNAIVGAALGRDVGTEDGGAENAEA